MILSQETIDFINAWKNDGINHLPGMRTLKYQNIFKEINDATSHLPSKYRLSHRLWWLQNQREPKCPECGKKSNLSDRLPIRESYCSQKCVALSNKVKEKKKQTNLRKYGVEDASKTPKALEKRSKAIKKSWETRERKYAHSYMPKKLTDKEWLIENHIKQNKSCTEIANELGVSICSVHRHIDLLNIERKKRNGVFSRSTQEVEIENFLAKNGQKFKTNYKPFQNSQKELDFYIPSLNFAIEHDGLYWHTFDHKPTTDEKYKHQQKKMDCIKHNIHLIQIWEHEWKTKRDIVESMILNQLNHESIIRIRASACSKHYVTSKTAAKFFQENHIQGSCSHRNGIYLGLYYKNQYVAIMSFGVPRFNKNYQWELIRFAVKKGYRVHGAASRLFKWFIKENCVEKTNIISYCNMRYGSGKLYDKLGFKFEKYTEPSYFYYNKNNNDKSTIPRYQAQKHRLEKLLKHGTYNRMLTEQENMFNNNYQIGYDSGNMVFSFIV